MDSKDRIELFLKYQNENMSFEDISNKLEIKPSTLRKTLNRNGYKSDKGIYVKVEENQSQISFEEIKNTEKNIKSKAIKGNNNKTKNTSKSAKNIKNNETVTKKAKKATKVKRDRKINISQEDMDKLCEVYDWYIQVKDNKALKPKNLSNKKDILIEDENINDIKAVNIRVDKSTWEEFERLCSNSSFNKKEIVTQALKDFMKIYKSLL